MKRLIIALALLIPVAAFANDATIQKMQQLLATKMVLSGQVKAVEKAAGIGLVLKPADKAEASKATVVWVTPKDPEWEAVKKVFAEAANRQANAAATELEKYKVTGPEPTLGVDPAPMDKKPAQ